ncbi:tRNA (adenosine(37)-N6)-threonylcarbamoyltransferase complex dimerization subunit type 1 TsaB [Buchnera aphidicola]|nr:tRNA (adenosine(37)-N6)-threonylcarbamoyltransferase complex dimerization subunit type 1 TsaB [Buchnera aphidicola]
MNVYKKILALDASVHSCSVALLEKYCIKYYFAKCNKNHTEKILPMLKKILRQGNNITNTIDAIAFSRGPGLFTSTRITINCAQGLFLGFQVPLISISSFNIIAEKIWRKKKINNVIILIHSSKNKFYWAIYNRNKQGIWFGEKTEESIEKKLIIFKINKLNGYWAITGNTLLIQEIIKNKKNNLFLYHYHFKYFHAQDMIPIAISKLKNKQTTKLKNIIPVYLE